MDPLVFWEMLMLLLKIVGITSAILALALLALWLYLERALLPKKSTRDFFAFSDMSFIQKLEGYLYGVRSDLYLRPAKWPWAVRNLEGSTANEYHGKVITRQDAGKIIKLDRSSNFQASDKVIPFPVARKVILEGNPPLAVMDCPCRAQKKDACEPRDVCMVVGDPFVSLVLGHRSGNARRITTEEALRILEQEEERGHIHTAWFKTVMHDRFYTICNCCTCCCLGMASYYRNVPRITHSGYRPVTDRDECTECGCCEDICPFKAVNCLEGVPVIDDTKCMGCGLCISHCPVEAVTLELAPERGVPLDLDSMAELES